LKNYQLSSYKSFEKGTTNIYFIKRDKYRFSYGISNDLKTQSIALKTEYVDENGRYSSVNDINQNFSFSSSQFIESGNMLITKIDFTSYFKKLKLSTNIGVLQNRTNTKLAVNASGVKKLNLVTSTYTLSGRTYFKFPVNLNFTLNVIQNKSKFNAIVSKTNWKSIAIELNAKLSDVLIASLHNKFYDLKNSNYNFMHFKLDYTPVKSKLAYQFKVNNIVNENLFVIESVSDYSIYKSTTKLLPRYVYLSAKYRF